MLSHLLHTMRPGCHRALCACRVVVLDIRFPTLPVAELSRHQACVNAVAWAPHSSCHICTAGDDRQALIWDLSAMGPSPAADAGSLGMSSHWLPAS